MADTTIIKTIHLCDACETFHTLGPDLGDLLEGYSAWADAAARKLGRYDMLTPAGGPARSRKPCEACGSRLLGPRYPFRAEAWDGSAV